MLISKAVEVSGIAVALFGRYWIKACRKMLEPVSATPLQCVSCEANRVFSWIFHSHNFSKVITVSTKYHDSIVLDVAKHLVGLERLLRCILKPCLPGPNQENPLHTQLLILPQLPPLPILPSGRPETSAVSIWTAGPTTTAEICREEAATLLAWKWMWRRQRGMGAREGRAGPPKKEKKLALELCTGLIRPVSCKFQVEVCVFLHLKPKAFLPLMTPPTK